MINRFLDRKGANILDEPPNEEDLHRVLTKTELRTLPLWLSNSTVAEQAILAKLSTEVRQHPSVMRMRAIGLLANRDYAGSEWILHSLFNREPDWERGGSLAVFVLAMRGNLERAQELASRFAPRGVPNREQAAYAARMQRLFGLTIARAPRR